MRPAASSLSAAGGRDGKPRPLRRVLVANRGEIALRLIRAAEDAGLESVAVYREEDAGALYVARAYIAVPLGPGPLAETYLSPTRLVEAARQSGADCVHPGYGFLSENDIFAQAVMGAGLTWIGPEPETIRMLGNKVRAKALAESVGAPVLAGSSGPVSGLEEVVEFAKFHGLPLAIKAANGGGGRGMRIVRSFDEIPEALASARREAQTAFGDSDCFVERCLESPRHVEAQVLGDGEGRVAVVGTRDCTLQRRYQKLVEEAPAPFLSPSQVDTIYESARAICREAGYRGAGTVEFLVGGHGEIFFLEVNTRLQVEHPVTEETAGIDLVGEMFRIAAGHPMSFDEEPAPRGHSIEFRINSEDPARGFLPNLGRLEEISWPLGPGVRVDAEVRAGDEAHGRYDSLLAKVIVTGADRPRALLRAKRALGELHIEGVATTLSFHKMVLDHPAFNGAQAFSVHTTWVESVLDFRAGSVTGEEAPSDQAIVLVGGRLMPVSLPALRGMETLARQVSETTNAATADRPVARRDAVLSPMQGTITRVAVVEGDPIERGQLIAVVEAMKMENPVTAHRDGTVTGLAVSPGDSVTQGQTVCQLMEPPDQPEVDPGAPPRSGM